MGTAGQPTGTVTFLFSDVVDHTRRWEQFPDAMPASLEQHDRIMRDSIARHDGYVFSTSGDAFAAAFARVERAAAAATQAQRALRSNDWPQGCELHVRMGIHTGEAQERDGDYYGPAVIRAARLMSLGHGGQVLVSDATASLLDDVADPGGELVRRGEVSLRGLARKELVRELRYPGLDEEFPPLTDARPRLGNLPMVTDELIGRVPDVAAATELLDGSSLVTLIGPGGVGKTRLAIEVGTLDADRRGDGVWFIPLATVTNGASVPSSVADVLGVQEIAGQSLTASIVGAVAGRNLLLILDNCEHVLAGARALAEAVVAECATVGVLTTSRESLGLPGEQVLPVPPLSTDRTGAAEVAPAIELFLTRARSADPDFVVDETSIRTIGSICTRLDGMPLAIELAAARVRGLGLEGLARHLDDRFRLLRSRGTADDRHQTLRATVGWSYDLLDDQLRDVFCRAGVFAGAFTAEAAEHVLALDDLDPLDVADGLADLVDKSMLQVHAASRRYRMLETMRQFGVDVADPDQLRRAGLRYVDHYAAWCLDRGRQLTTAEMGTALDLIHAEFDNLREAFRVAMSIDRHESAAEIVVSLHTYCIRRVVGEPWGWAADLAAVLSPDSPLYGDVVMSAAWGCRARGDRDGAVGYLQILERAEETNGLVPSSRADSLHGVTRWFFRQTERSVELQERAIAKARAAGDAQQESTVLASVSMAQDAYDRSLAERNAREAIRIGRETGSPEAICGGLLALAGVVVHTDPDEAVELVDELIQTATDSGQLWYRATATRLKAHALSRSGLVHEASETYADALALNGVGDFGELLWYTVLNAIEHLTRIGETEAAAVALGALTAAPAAPSDDLIARATGRMRTRLAESLPNATELETRGASMRLADLLRFLDGCLANHAAAKVSDTA